MDLNQTRGDSAERAAFPDAGPQAKLSRNVSSRRALGAFCHWALVFSFELAQIDDPVQRRLRSVAFLVEA